MRCACPPLVQVWVVLSDEATMGRRDARHRLVESVVARATPLSRPACVSWTASVDTLAVAASSGLSVGIDLERPVARREDAPYLAALASSCLSSREALAFEGVDASEQANWLLRRWTAKEAHLKRNGTGLRTAPATIEIDWPGSGQLPGVARALTLHDGPQGRRVSHLRSFTDSRAAFVCSLACERPLGGDEVEFRCVSASDLPQPSMLNTAQATGPSALRRNSRVRP